MDYSDWEYLIIQGDKKSSLQEYKQLSPYLGNVQEVDLVIEYNPYLNDTVIKNKRYRNTGVKKTKILPKGILLKYDEPKNDSKDQQN